MAFTYSLDMEETFLRSLLESRKIQLAEEVLQLMKINLADSCQNEYTRNEEGCDVILQAFDCSNGVTLPATSKQWGTCPLSKTSGNDCTYYTFW